MTIKKIKISCVLFIALLVLFVSARANAQTAPEAGANQSINPEHETDESIIAKFHKQGNEYTQPGQLEITPWNSEYLDDYNVFKGRVYNGGVISFSGKSLGYFPADSMIIIICRDNFDPKATDRGGCSEIPDGDIELRIPYFPNGKYVEIYNPQGEKIFTADLSSVAVCNENGLCDGKNENQNNCPSDCKPEQNIPNDSQKKQEGQQFNFGKALIFLIIFVILAGIGVLVIIWLKKRNKSRVDNI